MKKNINTTDIFNKNKEEFININKEYAIGVDLGGTNIVSAIINNQGEILSYLKVRTLAEGGREATIKRIIETIHKNIVQFQSTIAPDGIIGIGIGAPGPLDIKRGIIDFAPNLPGWRDVPLRKILKDEFSMKIVLENDANAAAWGERCFGVGQGVDNLVCFTLGTGIGGGIIIDGKIYHGNNYGSAELGHMTVNKDGPRCNCGNYGCLEAYSSATGIKNRIKSKVKKRRSKKKRAFYSNYKPLKIVIGKLDGNAGVLGAAALLWIPEIYSL